VREALEALGRLARSDGELVGPILTAVRRRATLGEISDVLREAWGEYTGS
jgi:methylmalonyl-CoA mutase N-terminal domain/subunit